MSDSFAWTPQRARIRRWVQEYTGMNTHTDHRRDDAAPETRAVPCPHCNGKGETVNTFTSTLDPNATREFRQRCYQCGGSGKAATE